MATPAKEHDSCAGDISAVSRRLPGDRSISLVPQFLLVSLVIYLFFVHYKADYEAERYNEDLTFSIFSYWLALPYCINFQDIPYTCLRFVHVSVVTQSEAIPACMHVVHEL